MLSLQYQPPPEICSSSSSDSSHGSFDMVVNPVSNHYVEDVDDGEKLGEYNIPTSILTRAVKR
jgi:hypothetical protein